MLNIEREFLTTNPNLCEIVWFFSPVQKILSSKEDT